MRKNINIFNLILKVGYDIFCILCVILVVIILLQKFTENEKTIWGYRIFTVVSGSMEPKYSIGEVVISKEVDINTIKVGDSIVYKGMTGDVKGKTILHDVVEIEYRGDDIIFHAKGLENTQGDPDIYPDQIYGICVLQSYVLTLLYNLATSTYASAIIIIFLVLNVFLSFRSKKSNKKKLPDGEGRDNTLNKKKKKGLKNSSDDELNNESIDENSEIVEDNCNDNEDEDEKIVISLEEKEQVISKYHKITNRYKYELKNRLAIDEEIRKRQKNN